MDKKRGQAAFEFLTTYGWAFMVIMITIGAMAYFGILDMEGLLPERCTLPPDFICQDHRVNGQTEFVDIQLRHNIGETINLQNVTCIFDDGNSFTDNSVAGEWDPKETVTAGCDAAAATPTSTDLTSGQKEKMSVIITYRLEPSGYDHYAEGELYANTR